MKLAWLIVRDSVLPIVLLVVVLGAAFGEVDPVGSTEEVGVARCMVRDERGHETGPELQVILRGTDDEMLAIWNGLLAGPFKRMVIEMPGKSLSGTVVYSCGESEWFADAQRAPWFGDPR